MTVILNVNNTDYFYPEQGDINWGVEATDWAVAVTSGMLQKSGGLFQLLGEVDFGPNYGLKSTYFKSRTANPAAAGTVRLANGDSINWRNLANDADLPLGVNSINQLTFNGQVLAQSSSYINILDYGAVGNGVTVDSTAIQAAVDAAEASQTKKIVYFPNADLGYVIDTPIIVPAGVTLLGDNYKGGERSRIKPASGYSGHMIESKGFATPLKQNRINIVGLFLDGSDTTLTAVNLITQESAIINVTIKNCFTYGIRIGGISSSINDLALNNFIQNCYLAGFGGTQFYDAIFIDYYSADTTISTTYIENCQDACIRSRASNDIIEDNHLYASNYLYFSETSDDKLFSGNYLENADSEAICILEGSGGNLVLNAVISNNVMRNINRLGGADGAITILGPNTTSLVVSNNVLRRDNGQSYAADYLVHLDVSAASLATLDNTKIFGNSFEAGTITISETNIASTYFSNKNVPAKGDLIVGSGTDGATLNVGTNGDVLTVDSAEPTGVKWAPPVTILPPGVVFPYTGSSTPAGYLLCDGSAVSRSTYSNLFAVIGITAGQGDGSTTFNVPDYRGQFLRGVSGAVNTDPNKLTRTAMNTGGNTGNNVNSVQSSAVANHTHNIAAYRNAGAGGPNQPTAVSNAFTAVQTTPNYGATDNVNPPAAVSTETRPTNAYVNYIIKT